MDVEARHRVHQILGDDQDGQTGSRVHQVRHRLERRGRDHHRSRDEAGFEQAPDDQAALGDEHPAGARQLRIGNAAVVREAGVGGVVHGYDGHRAMVVR